MPTAPVILVFATIVYKFDVCPCGVNHVAGSPCRTTMNPTVSCKSVHYNQAVSQSLRSPSSDPVNQIA